MPVSWTDLLLAFEFVSASGTGEHQVFLSKQTGSSIGIQTCQMNSTNCLRISMMVRDIFRFPISESLISVSRLSLTLWTSSYRTTSPQFSEYSVEKVPTLDSRTCWLEGANSINGTISNQKLRNTRCGAGAIVIPSRSAMKTKAPTEEKRDNAIAGLCLGSNGQVPRRSTLSVERWLSVLLIG